MMCPLPRYWMCHALVALLIAGGVTPFLGFRAGFASGFAFYAGREFTQWEDGLGIDWKGLLAPLVACALGLAICLALAGPAQAHQWYDSSCCSNRDCERLPDDAVSIEEGGYRVRYKAKLGMNVDVLVPFGGVKPSRDGHYHGCANTTAFLCLYVPVNA